jgi:hypothetical protein
MEKHEMVGLGIFRRPGGQCYIFCPSRSGRCWQCLRFENIWLFVLCGGPHGCCCYDIWLRGSCNCRHYTIKPTQKSFCKSLIKGVRGIKLKKWRARRDPHPQSSFVCKCGLWRFLLDFGKVMGGEGLLYRGFADRLQKSPQSPHPHNATFANRYGLRPIVEVRWR